jgi:hypothetical protein
LARSAGDGASDGWGDSRSGADRPGDDGCGGDAGNLLWDVAAGPDVAVLTDWDWVSYGPREIDLVPTWHAAARYGRGTAWTTAFVARYGYDLAGWAGFVTLMRMRDLVQISGPLRRASDSEPHRAALRERITAIRAGDTSTTWTAL